MAQRRPGGNGAHAGAHRDGTLRQAFRRSGEPADDRRLRTARRALTCLFGPLEDRGFAVRLWDGSVEAPPGAEAPPFTLVLRGPASLRRMFLPPSEARLTRAYLDDTFDVEGDIEATAALGDLLASRFAARSRLARLLPLLLALPAAPPAPATEPIRAPFRARGRRHTPRRDAGAVRFHYDVGNDFFALWLDPRMVYSCAYFRTGAEDLGEAQEAKLDLICRKLRLSAGERLLDIGCGWGGLLVHAAQRYAVVATGITLSEPQADLARRRIAERGLAERCRVEVRDYRDLPEGAVFDKIASVGMVEHVGLARLPEYFGQAWRVLAPGGLFLNQGIVAAPAHPRPTFPVRASRGTFIDRYIFPDGELVPLGEILRAAEQVGFEPRDVENLRAHYALTLRHWLRRLESRHGEAAALVGESTYRAWRLYLGGCASTFADGRLGVIQMLLVPPDRAGRARIPLTREDLYAAGSGSLARTVDARAWASAQSRDGQSIG